jgi:hypothetical protein
MTVQELIDELESFDGDAEVRFLAQPPGRSSTRPPPSSRRPTDPKI